MSKPDNRLRLYYRQYEIEFEKYETESQPMHLHDAYEIEFVTKGSGVHRLNNKEYSIKRGMMYALRLRDYHEIQADEPITVHRIKMPLKCMPEKLSYGMLKNKANMITQIDEALTLHIENLFLFLESRPKALLNDEIYIQESLINIIVTLFTNHETANPGDVYVTEEAKVEMVMLYLQDNFRQKLTIADVAKCFNMNPNYLNRIFKAQKGITLYAAIKNFRLEYAKKLLVETELSSSEVCTTCGYSGDANFLRDFKKEFGTSPMKYRKTQREKLKQAEE